MENALISRMKGRKQRFVGVTNSTAPALEASFLAVVSLLEAHFFKHRYLLGGRVTFADFALFGQCYCMSTDPTASEILRSHAPSLTEFVLRMSLGCPRDCTGHTASWEELSPTLLPLLTTSVSGWFLPWTAANEVAAKHQDKSFSVMLPGNVLWTQQTSKFQVKTFTQLKGHYTALVAEDAIVAAIMEQCGCRKYLEGPQLAPHSRL